ncbi:MAG: 5-carboxymethyl-2-hydroxymuconate Delta-isomerase [Limisphaerales bacterium]
MPHCILDCSQTIETHAPLDDIIKTVHDAAVDSGLFGQGDVKVRARLFEHYTIGGEKKDFLHIIAYILSGRSEEQREDLSRRIIVALKELLPNVPVLSIDVREINRATYNNRNTV